MPRSIRKVILGLLVSAGLLAMAEVGLRMLVEEAPETLTSPLAFQRHEEPIVSPGPTEDSVIYGGPNIVALREPVGIRIFFFGGSATEGYHMTRFSGFAGWTQRFLQLLLPDTPVEVINLGAGGEGSRQVADLVRAAAQTQSASLFVVYSGNNEYYELRALKQANPDFDVRAELARRRLSGSHLYRHLRRLVRPAALSAVADEPVRGVDSIEAEINPDERELGVLLYGEHMARLIRDAREAGVPVLLSTVADQLRSFAFHGAPPELSAGVQDGVRALDEAGRRRDWVTSSAALQDVQPLLKSQADHHAVATLLERDQRWDAAKHHYEMAEYLDPRPRRSSEPMRDTLRGLAVESGAGLCDTSVHLAAQSRGGITGEDVFFDPCHPNALGHRRIAEILVGCMIEQSLLPGLEGKAAEFRRLLAETPLAGADGFRLDHFTERRAQLHENRAMTEEEVIRTIRAFDDGTALGAATAGHHATLFKLHEGALAWYELAEARGGPVGSLALSRALTLQRLHDLEGARGALRVARDALPGDVEVEQFLRTLGG